MPEVVNGEIWDRNDFGTLCEWRMLYRIVEIGVDRGEFAVSFMNRSHNCDLYIGVDPYLPYPGMPFDRESDYLSAVIRFERKSRIAKLLRMTSDAAAVMLSESVNLVYNKPFGMVYIDGDHSYESVLNDMNVWWSRIEDRGILAGHDWQDESGDNAGVQQAVREFADKHGLPVHVTWKDNPTSWWIYKDGSTHPWKEENGRG